MSLSNAQQTPRDTAAAGQFADLVELHVTTKGFLTHESERTLLETGIRDFGLSLTDARGVVHALAKLQGNDTDDDTDEQPGKILHELRFSQSTSFSLRAGAPYFGSVDATPLFVHLVGELARWSSWGADEIGPLMPKTAIWKRWPGRASRVSTTRLGALKPATTWPPPSPSWWGSAPSTHTSA